MEIERNLKTYNMILEKIMSIIKISMQWIQAHELKEQKSIEYMKMIMPGKVHLHYVRAEGSMNWMVIFI